MVLVSIFFFVSFRFINIVKIKISYDWNIWEKYQANVFFFGWDHVFYATKCVYLGFAKEIASARFVISSDLFTFIWNICAQLENYKK